MRTRTKVALMVVVETTPESVRPSDVKPRPIRKAFGLSFFAPHLLASGERK